MTPPSRTARRALGGLALAGVAAALVWWRLSDPSGAATGLLRPDDTALLQRGEQLYRVHCASCHGENLQGQPNWRERGTDGRLPAPPHDDSGHTWHHPDAQLFDITRRGMAAVIQQPGYPSAMPAYQGVLSDADIVAVLSWIKAQWPPELRAHHDQVNAQARSAGR